MQKERNAAGTGLRGSIAAALAKSPLIIAGVLSSPVVGALVIVAWLAKGVVALEVVESFAIGALAWMRGLSSQCLPQTAASTMLN